MRRDLFPNVLILNNMLENSLPALLEVVLVDLEDIHDNLVVVLHEEMERLVRWDGSYLALVQEVLVHEIN